MDLFESAVTNGDTLVVTNDVKGMRYEFITLNKKEEKQRRVCRLFTPEGTVIENPWNQRDIAGSARLLTRMVDLNPDWTTHTEPQVAEAAHDTWNKTGAPTNKSMLNRMAVDVRGKVVLVTGGELSGMSRRQVGVKLEEAGAKFVKNLSKKVDLVLVAGLADQRYKYDGYGGKVADALALQESGHPIEIADCEATLAAIRDR